MRAQNELLNVGSSEAEGREVLEEDEGRYFREKGVSGKQNVFRM